MSHILRVDSSMRKEGSTTRTLTDQIVEKLDADTLTVRDLGNTGGGNLTDTETMAITVSLLPHAAAIFPIIRSALP